MIQQTISVQTTGRGAIEITHQVQSIVSDSKLKVGLCNLFIQHTSASLIICENAAPEVHVDLEYFMSRVAPDADPAYRHDDEGPDDMAAHIRTIITQTSLTIPITNARCALGTWQGVHLWEHRTHAHKRDVIITIS